VCWCQESGLAVTLRLLGMRSREVAERLLPVLAPAAEAMRKMSQQLATWLLVHKEASAATEQAQAANVEAARLQVAMVSGNLMVLKSDVLFPVVSAGVFSSHAQGFQEKTQVYLMWLHGSRHVEHLPLLAILSMAAMASTEVDVYMCHALAMSLIN
jgi:hypothetical protein